MTDDYILLPARLPLVAEAERREMLQFPALMRQWPSPALIPASTLLPVPATSHEDELLLAMAESDLEDKVALSIPFPNGRPPRFPTLPTRCQRDKLTLPFVSALLGAQLNEIRKTNSNLVFIGKPTGDTKEEYDAEVEEEDADNVEESDGDDFDQETG
ncbi:hypothetical protein HU200_039050 [Digitaria exilis]|uniref:Uncharacterized protein n=1 Tax=Digitaria exilis TaxID=1010633 RepID=A0A835BHZ9_9POAL|nr:hypothetical protein HU200_039050 [Digitaria exilis]